jgi:hypothetical protein
MSVVAIPKYQRLQRIRHYIDETFYLNSVVCLFPEGCGDTSINIKLPIQGAMSAEIMSDIP